MNKIKEVGDWLWGLNSIGMNSWDYKVWPSLEDEKVQARLLVKYKRQIIEHYSEEVYESIRVKSKFWTL